jgi:DNA-binding PadR family transcriptional regulator
MLKNFTMSLSPLPLSKSGFYILLALTERELYAYEIRARIKYYSKNKVIISPGVLFPALKTLLQGKLIEEIETPRSPFRGRGRRQYYGITDTGHSFLTIELWNMKIAIKIAKERNLI